MKFVTIADTHGKHADLSLPSGDVLIHAGDVSMNGRKSEILDFLQWFENQNFENKIIIAGNHDFYFERAPAEEIGKIMPHGVIYLQDNEIVINGIKIWGSPITPWFFNWAFNRHRGAPIQQHWNVIPSDADIVITHGPIYMTLDTTAKGQHVGCKDLRDKILEIQPSIHVCGHIHESYGLASESGIRFINASVVNEKYEVINNPIVFER